MNHTKLLKAAVFAAAIALVPVTLTATAFAQPTSNDPRERAKHYYAEGRKNYDLGNFTKAVENFKKAYEELPDGAFLFNIAQAYRQLDDCKNALFFYKRFMSVKKDAPEATRKEVEGHIKSLEECVKNQETIRNRPPDGTEPPDGGGTGTGGTGTGGTGTGGTGTGGTGTGTGGTGTGGTGTGTGGTGTGATGTGTGTGDGRVADGGDNGNGDGDGDGDGDDGGEVVETTGQPKLLAAHANFGAAKVGAGSLEVPVQVAFAITAGYPIAISDKLVIDAGAGFGFTPVPWSSGAVDGSASMTNVFANVGATFGVAPKISVRGDLGAGLLFLGGLAMGNPFTEGGAATTGALSMPLVRFGLSGEYAISKNLAAALTPIAFSFSPSKDGMKEEISSLTRIEFTLGLGYRM